MEQFIVTMATPVDFPKMNLDFLQPMINKSNNIINIIPKDKNNFLTNEMGCNNKISSQKQVPEGRTGSTWYQK